MDTNVLNKAADNIRILAASMVEQAKSGHPGGAMGGADFVNVLYSKFWLATRTIPHGLPATASSSTPATCHRCYTPFWQWPDTILPTS